MSFNELTDNKFTNSILENALSGCDDGELYLEDTINESFLFDDNVLKSSSSALSTLIPLVHVHDMSTPDL